MHKAFLFDLDDTIFDHQHSRRTALGALAAEFHTPRPHGLQVWEATHERHLQTTHMLVLEGRLSVADAHRERMRLLSADLGIELIAGRLDAIAALYRRTYDSSRRAIPGVVELLTALKGRGKVAVVTNGLALEQREKLRICRVEGLADSVVISELAGAKKPDRAIFEIALNELGVSAPEAVVIGDSWKLDVLGARGAGIRAVWLNRYGAQCPESAFALEVNSFEPLERMLAVLERLSPA